MDGDADHLSVSEKSTLRNLGSVRLQVEEMGKRVVRASRKREAKAGASRTVVPEKDAFLKVKVTTKFADAGAVLRPPKSKYSRKALRRLPSVELRYRPVEVLEKRGIVPDGYGRSALAGSKRSAAGAAGIGGGGGASYLADSPGGGGGGASSESAKKRRREKREAARAMAGTQDDPILL